eukprot:scaffold271262_cov23-Tisochrysis_lutea.AAC.1
MYKKRGRPGHSGILVIAVAAAAIVVAHHGGSELRAQVFPAPELVRNNQRPGRARDHGTMEGRIWMWILKGDSSR